MLRVLFVDTAEELSAAAYRPQLLADRYETDCFALRDFDSDKIRKSAVYLDRIDIRKLYHDAASGGYPVYEKQIIAFFNAGSCDYLICTVERISAYLDLCDLKKHAHYKYYCHDHKKKCQRPIDIFPQSRLVGILALPVIIICIRHLTSP